MSPSHSKGVSIASLVVPAIGETITLLSSTRAFINEDLPTFGFPITETLISSVSSYLLSGNDLTISSRTSPRLSIFTEEIGIGSPSPKV